MNHKIIDGKSYVVGELRWHVVDVPDPMFTSWSTTKVRPEMFDGETFVPLESAEAIDVHNKVLRDIYRRLDALESKVK